MSEVSSWSATDASNNLTPPDGWPEGMQPSGVNNVGRMMMGAIARWYSTVSAGIANALPLSGGVLTGPLTAPALFSTGSISSALDIYAGRTITGSGNLNISGAAGISNGLTTNNIHATSNIVVDGQLDVGGTLNSGTTNTANLTVNGSEGVTGNLTVAGFVNPGEYRIQGALFAGRGTDGAGTLNDIYDGSGGIALALYGPNGSYYRCDNAHSFTNRAATLNICRFQATDGNCINASGFWNSVSDAAVKKNLEPYRAGLAEVLKLNPCSFDYTSDAPFGAGSRRFGLVAQEVAQVLPEIVGETSIDEKTYMTMEPGLLVFALVNSCRDLAARNDELAARIERLEGGR